MTDTEAADTEAPDSETAIREANPDQEANKILFRAIGRALARMDAGTGNLKGVWTEGRAKYITDARKLAKALKKERVTLTVEAKAADDTADPDD